MRHAALDDVTDAVVKTDVGDVVVKNDANEFVARRHVEVASLRDEVATDQRLLDAFDRRPEDQMNGCQKDPLIQGTLTLRLTSLSLLVRNHLHH